MATLSWQHLVSAVLYTANQLLQWHSPQWMGTVWPFNQQAFCTAEDPSQYDIINQTKRQRDVTKMPTDNKECQLSSVAGMVPHLYDIIQFIQHYHIFLLNLNRCHINCADPAVMKNNLTEYSDDTNCNSGLWFISSHAVLHKWMSNKVKKTKQTVIQVT